MMVFVPNWVAVRLRKEFLDVHYLFLTRRLREFEVHTEFNRIISEAIEPKRAEISLWNLQSRHVLGHVKGVLKLDVIGMVGIRFDKLADLEWVSALVYAMHQLLLVPFLFAHLLFVVPGVPVDGAVEAVVKVLFRWDLFQLVRCVREIKRLHHC